MTYLTIDVTLENVVANFPIGTNVGLYQDSISDGGSLQPVGPALQEAVVAADGSLTFNDVIANGATYAAMAKVGGAWKRINVTTKVERPDELDTASAELEALITLEQDARETADDALAATIEAKTVALAIGKVYLIGEEDADVDTERLQEALGNETRNEILLSGAAGTQGFRTKATIEIENYKQLTGAGRGNITIITAEDGLDDDVLRSAEYGVNGKHDITIRDLVVDGNYAGNADGSCIVLDTFRGRCWSVFALNAARDGFYQRAFSDEEGPNGGLDNHLYDCHADTCGRYGIFRDDHDYQLIKCSAIQCASRGVLTEANGLLDGVHVWSYASDASAADVGMELAGNAMCINCTAEGASVSEVIFHGNVRWLGGEIFNATGFPNSVLIDFQTAGFNQIVGTYLHNWGTGGAFKFTNGAGGSLINAAMFDPGGNPYVAEGGGEPSASVVFELFPGGTSGRGTVPGYRTHQRRTFSPINAATNDVPNNTMYANSADENRLGYKDNGGTRRRVLVGKQAALTAEDATAIDNEYGEVERKVVENIRTRQKQLEERLTASGLFG